MADVVFVLGAGCSAHAGAPLMANFLDVARDVMAQGEAEDRQDDFQKVFSILGDLQRVHSKAQLDIVNIESIFGAFDLGRILRKLPGVEPDAVEAAIASLKWLIVRTLERTVMFPTRGSAIVGTEDYARFATLLRGFGERRVPMSTAVITFNYDICLDVALDDEQLPFTYALDGGDARLPMLKLHGSLNWARKRDASIVEWPIKAYRQKYRRNWPADDHTRIYAPIAQHMAKELGGEITDGMPVIVPPTWNKGEHQMQLSRVWERAAKELSRASHVIVMGYSLPETDQFFRLLYGLGSEGSVPLQSFSVFNPSADVRARFECILGPGALARFKFHQLTFDKAIAHLKEEFKAYRPT
jgi:hypothetical protein